MKEDGNQPKPEEVPLDSVTFPEQMKDATEGCKCGHDHGDKKCRHEHEDDEKCACHDGDGACGCSHAEGECECNDEDGLGEGGEIDPALLARLDAIVKENLALRDMLVRNTADFDNYRKRTVREKEEARKMANADFVKALLPALDTMTLALDAARKHHPEASGVLDGIDMIAVQLKSTLKAQGVDEITPQPGDAFDTALHESIAHQPSDTVEEGKISALARTGYILNGRLLRAASVVISSGKAKK